MIFCQQELHSAIMFCRNYLQFNRQFWYFVLFCRSALLCRFNIPTTCTQSAVTTINPSRYLPKIVLPDAFCGIKTKIDFDRDSTGGAYTAPPGPIAGGWRGLAARLLKNSTPFGPRASTLASPCLFTFDYLPSPIKHTIILFLFTFGHDRQEKLPGAFRRFLLLVTDFTAKQTLNWQIFFPFGAV